MFKKNTKKEEVGKDKDEILTEIVSSLKALNTRMDNMEGNKQPVQKQQLPEQEVVTTPTTKTTEKIQATYEVQEVPTQTERVIVDVSDPNDPKGFDTSTALAELLNKVSKIEKNLG